jgi:hypothetical protein
MADVNTINDKNEEPVQMEEEQIHLENPEAGGSLTNALLRILGIDKKELEALGEVNVSQLKGVLLSTLKDNAVGISTALLAFVPFIGEYFLAGKAVYAEGEKVKESVMKKIRDKIKLQIPEVKIPEAEIEMQNFSTIPQSLPIATPLQTETVIAKGGARARNTNAILRRIEKSKKAFHNTNKSNASFGKSKKPRKTRRRMKQSRK